MRRHRAYCTTLATNYLPKALALAESVRRHEAGATLTVLFVDVIDRNDLPQIDGIETLCTGDLGLPPRTVLEMAMSYEILEFATSFKPLLLQRMLEGADQVFFLDPDTYVVAPMDEIGPALRGSEGGVLLTPHFLEPASRDADLSDGHLLLVGVFNTGFVGVDARARDFLDWWWSHLRRECLYDPLSALFVDQKWLDIGSSMFKAATLYHAGYNIAVDNLPERPLLQDEAGYWIGTTGERVRLFHFHAFDPNTPKTLSNRRRHDRDHELDDDSIILQLCKEYAEVLGAYQHALPPAPAYPYATDTQGRRISRQLRRAYLRDAQRRLDDHGDYAGEAALPSPFVRAEAAAYERWRRQAWKPISRGLLAEAARSARIILPEEYDRLRKRFPGLADLLMDRFAGGSGSWS